MHCDPKWDQPQDIVLAGMFFILGQALGDPSSTKAINQLKQKTQKELYQQMVGTFHRWVSKCELSYLLFSMIWRKLGPPG
jgi:hypothetical protein